MQYAVIGTGWIVDSYIEGCEIAGNCELAAICSRTREKGLAFGEKYGVSKVYTSVEELAESEIPAVYIASPNALHYKQARCLLEAGKHVICEKPITVTPAECEVLQKLAAQKGLIYLEAIMMMHLPQRKIVEELLPKLGRITSVRFDFSQLSSKYPAYLRGELPNIFNPKMATGSLMDLGVYCVYPAVAWFGMPDEVWSSASFLESGADESCAAVLKYSDKLVVLNCSKTGQSRLGSEVIGDEGTLAIDSISKLTGIRLFDRSGNVEEVVGDIEKNVLMSGEAGDFYRYITQPEETAEEYRCCSQLAVNVSRLMEKIRMQSGIHFEEETL
ncbi:MAG: Gfo/Idh/MocA family protein [Candidatus Merdivicinus sp.]|jgi:predicted dehydrogenase